MVNEPIAMGIAVGRAATMNDIPSNTLRAKKHKTQLDRGAASQEVPWSIATPEMAISLTSIPLTVRGRRFPERTMNIQSSDRWLCVAHVVSQRPNLLLSSVEAGYVVVLALASSPDDCEAVVRASLVRLGVYITDFDSIDRIISTNDFRERDIERAARSLSPSNPILVHSIDSYRLE